MSLIDPHDRVAGALLGVALGDALGLPFEGLSALRVRRRAGTFDRFRLLGRTGYVSDDTEQTALLAEALAGGGGQAAILRRFRRSMIGWLARLPFGIGFSTLRACTRMALGCSSPGVRSAGNGAMMRAGIVGAHLASAPSLRREIGRAVAALTHTDPRGVEAALYVAEVSARAVVSASSADPHALVRSARSELEEPATAQAVDRALELAADSISVEEAAEALGNTGFAVHSAGLATFCFVRFGASPMRAIEAAIRAGGDTDTHAAIVGGWVGALHGASALPRPLLDAIHDGPFGPTHLASLAASLATGAPVPRWSPLAALARNLALYPVILAHGFSRLLQP